MLFVKWNGKLTFWLTIQPCINASMASCLNLKKYLQVCNSFSATWVWSWKVNWVYIWIWLCVYKFAIHLATWFWSWKANWVYISTQICVYNPIIQLTTWFYSWNLNWGKITCNLHLCLQVCSSFGNLVLILRG
jgi:hypothetical protein